MTHRTVRDFGIIACVWLVSTVVFYGVASNILPKGMDTVYKNWDGPAYIVVAKSLYNPKVINGLPKLPYINRPSYYTQQFPLYPLLIRAFSFIGYERAMIAVSLIFGLCSIYMLYLLVRLIRPEANALVVSLVSLFYLPRWFINYHVGSSEPIFLFFLMYMWYLLLHKRYWVAAFSGALMMLTRPAGIFFGVGILMYILMFEIQRARRYAPLLLMFLALGVLYIFFGFQFGDILIHIKEYNAHPIAMNSVLKNFSHPEGYYDIWKEGLLFIYLFYFISFGLLWRQKQYLLVCTVIPYALYVLFVYHPDISRYLLPLLPLAMIAYAHMISDSYVYVPLFMSTPVIGMLAISYISYNVL